MKNWLRNIDKVVLKRLVLKKNDLSKEAIRIRKLRNNQESDAVRWSRQDVLHQHWEERTLILSKFIKDNSSVVEFGAGSAAIKDNLNASIRYQPVDIVKRQEDFLACDLNKQPLLIDLEPYDTALFSGVLEYVYDVYLLFSVLKKNIKHIPLPYTCSVICNQDRLKNGWLSDYTQQELELIFKNNGYSILATDMWKDQKLYNLYKK